MAKKNYMKEFLEQYGRLNTSYRNSFNQGDIVQRFKREITNTVNSPCWAANSKNAGNGKTYKLLSSALI